jgi:S1-C subfamily serine protease
MLDGLIEMCTEQYDDCLGVGDDPAPLPPLPEMTGPGRFDVPMAFVQYHLGRLDTLDAETFMMLVPNAAGDPVGIELNSIDAGSTLETLGLENGDVVVAVNDTSIMAYKGNPAALLGLVSKAGVKLTIRRNGNKRDLRYHLVN